MHENAPVLEAKKRERLGSRYSRRIREGGGLPAVVYGHKHEPVSVHVDHKRTLGLLESGERVFQLAIEGGKPELVLIKGVQFDHLGTNVIHADFARVDLDERVRTKVALHYVGEAKGLSAGGAMLTYPNTEIEIECALRDLPEFLEVDVSALDVGDEITAGTLALPSASMRLLSDPNGAVAQLRISKRAVSVAGEEGAAAPTAETPAKT